MPAFTIHLILSAYVAPVIGALMIAFLGPVLSSPVPASSVAVMDTILFAFFAPWLSWYVFVPLACCSFFFFRFTATRQVRGLVFWITTWCVIGTGSAIVFAWAVDVRSNHFPLILTGAIVGLLIAPIHRIVWRQLYAPQLMPLKKVAA